MSNGPRLQRPYTRLPRIVELVNNPSLSSVCGHWSIIHDFSRFWREIVDLFGYIYIPPARHIFIDLNKGAETEKTTSSLHAASVDNKQPGCSNKCFISSHTHSHSTTSIGHLLKQKYHHACVTLTPIPFTWFFKFNKESRETEASQSQISGVASQMNLLPARNMQRVYRRYHSLLSSTTYATKNALSPGHLLTIIELQCHQD